MYNVINFICVEFAADIFKIFPFCVVVCLLHIFHGSTKLSVKNSISFVHFYAKIQFQYVMCMCNLSCQNPTEQGLTITLLTISFGRSVRFFKYWSRFLIVTCTISSSVVCLIAEIQYNHVLGIALITAMESKTVLPQL